jgi:membrane protein DedA with SNARE-associated domain
MFDHYIEPIIEFLRANAGWAAPIVGVLAFSESLAFLSVFVPAWGILVGVGAMIGSDVLSFWPVWIAASIGAALGDWLSYWIGWYFKDRVHHMWPFTRNPQALPKAEAFFARWGAFGVFIGRFFGPLRATVPLAAGIFEMPQVKFQIANVASAFVWAAVLLLGGATGLEAVKAVKGSLGW